MIVFLFVCFWKWDLKVTWLSSGTYQSLFHKGLKFPYDGKYKSALNVCVVSSQISVIWANIFCWLPASI